MFYDRLKELRHQKKLTQVQFASALSVSSGTVAMWETGKRTPDTEMLTRIARFFGVSVDYLIGNTEVRAPFVIDQKLNNGYPVPAALLQKFREDSEKDELYENYRGLDEHGKKMVDFVLKEERIRCSSSLNPKISTADGCDTIEIKLCNMPASAGTGDYLSEDGYEYCTAPRTELTERADYAVRVNGDSMEPTFFDGDILLVCGVPYINVGDIGIFIVNGDGFVKEFGGNKLISHNKLRNDIFLTEHDVVICSGLVIGKL